MTRLRPSTSATAPVNGAVAATASVLAVMIRLAVGGADAELLRHQRQHRLRRIKMEEGADRAEHMAMRRGSNSMRKTIAQGGALC